MKVILSRKGFDSANGGIPSPILPDGEMLSLPIPSDDCVRYDELSWHGVGYRALLDGLRPGFAPAHCHLDPDLRPGLRRETPAGWQPAFGQIRQSQRYLAQTARVAPGDLFLFFGTFRPVGRTADGGWRYVPHAAAVHAIYGWLQIGEIVTDPARIARCPWHPHAAAARLADPTNALYLPGARLSFAPTLPGCGVFPFAEKRVLTLAGCTKGVWRDNPVYRPEAVVGRRKNAAPGPGVYYAGVWQELALRESPACEAWARGLFD